MNDPQNNQTGFPDDSLIVEKELEPDLGEASPPADLKTEPELRIES